MLFRWLFRKQLAELAHIRVDLASDQALTQAAAAEALDLLAKARESKDRLDALAQLSENLAGTISGQITGFNARYNDLAVASAESLARLSAKAEASVDEIKGSFQGLIDARVKAEMGKWAFTGGAGGALAAHQYCTRCTAQVTRWSMLPDEGPVCAKCLNLPL